MIIRSREEIYNLQESLSLLSLIHVFVKNGIKKETFSEVTWNSHGTSVDDVNEIFLLGVKSLLETKLLIYKSFILYMGYSDEFGKIVNDAIRKHHLTTLEIQKILNLKKHRYCLWIETSLNSNKTPKWLENFPLEYIRFRNLLLFFWDDRLHDDEAFQGTALEIVENIKGEL
ncbi:TPA: hypothetical protein QCY08_003065 [Bacillus paranthracis]|nr:hypothetical protein [Bacillus paranthracis]